MIINHNIAALNTLTQLNKNTTATQKSLEKLSSGLRINGAADDAAGLAISEKMKGQIRGLDQASRNAQDGISLVQTAEGSLNETQDILQRMRELAVQSSNDTSTDADRKEIQKEISQLKDEVDRISNDTEFNTKKLLNGSVGNSAVLSTDNLALKTVSVADAKLAADTYTVKNVAPATVSANINTNTTGLAATDLDFTTAGASTGLKLGNYTLNVTDGATAGNFDFQLSDENGVVVAKVSDVNYNGGTDAVLVGSGGQKLTISAGSTVQAGQTTLNINAKYAATGDFTITNSAGGGVYSNAANTVITDSDFEAGGFQFSLDIDSVRKAAATTSTITTTNNALTMHIGANENQTMNVDINKMDTKSLGVDNVDVTTQAGAETAITAVNDAITKVSSERAKLGAFQNRLEHTVNNLSASSENLTAAQSRIADVDMAAEMSSFTKNNILNQAAQAMLAQANQLPQGVLQLLR
ncbi:flagellin [Sporolactobacillus laevolacticus]|uniref:Flagellin n=1 Tax=Sporolactobacillus laevolacticus DSM 442 TaxID=1395513 RepID=V6J1P1_9BACL|nr:flagellin [Sporolactobacillus laevolacticus]EST10659.1 flagellin [Sporolactobacillus laevolacticus DSM 442]